MNAKIKGAEYCLADIFCDKFDFVIPPYQRPYAWTEEETDTLFSDLYDFYTNEDEEENYFLGSIVLIKEEGNPHSEVIDGQQRLTTLTILLSVLTSYFKAADLRSDYNTYIIEPGKKSKKLLSKPRLCIRPRDNVFFKQYIQEMGFLNSSEDAKGQDTEAKKNIIQNTKLLCKKIEESFDTTNDDELESFCYFLVNRCYIVVVSTPTKESAFRVFSVMNSRGLSLQVTDIIKADIIGALPEAQRQLYTDKWEEMETELTRNGFKDLFSQIRMIKSKKKAKKSLQDEFYSDILLNISSKVAGKEAADFIDNTLYPYSEAYSIIKGNCYTSSENASDVNYMLSWLNRIDNSDWLPVAMLYFVKNSGRNIKPSDFLLFLKKLERLAAFMRATSWNVNQRIERYAKVLKDIEDAEGSEFGTSIELTNDEIQSFIANLNGDIYNMTSNKRNYLILRLDSFLSPGEAIYNPRVLSIEHILPQTVRAGSEWEKNWPDEEERKKYLHRIGNLIPLARRKNSEASNYEFNVKRDKYFNIESGVTSYRLATEVQNYHTWTPEIVEERQKKLVAAFIKGWDLVER